MAIPITELADELTNDPQGFGYSTMNDVEAADALNLPRGTIVIARSAIPMGEVYGAVDWDTDYIGLTDLKKDGWQVLTSTPALDGSSQHVRDAIAAIWSGTTTETALLGLADRDGSRAEELWGEGERVSHQQVAEARGQ